MKEQKHMIHDGYTRINPARPNIQPANKGPRAPISISKIDFVVLTNYSTLGALVLTKATACTWWKDMELVVPSKEKDDGNGNFHLLGP